MMSIDATRKPASAALRSGVLIGLLFAAGCSGQTTSGNKLDDPELKANMKAITDQFKAKSQQAKTNTARRGSSKGFNHP